MFLHFSLTPIGEGDMLSRMKDRNMRDLVYLINKPPRWNEQVRDMYWSCMLL